MKERKGDEVFAEYLKEIEKVSEGKYQGTEEDFVRQYAFYMTVTYPMIKAVVDAMLKK